jgi:hypothetical protein
MKRRYWTSHEIHMLQNRYRLEGPTKLAEELGRSEDSVSGLAWRLGLRTQRRPYRPRELQSSHGPLIAKDGVT